MKTRWVTFALFGALIVPSCTEQPTLNPPDDTPSVRFRSLVTRPDRGINIEELSTTNFGLWAYQGVRGSANWAGYAVTANAEVLGGGAGGYANPSQAVYWPSGNDLLGFYAYAPYSSGNAYGIANQHPLTVGGDVTEEPSFDFRVASQVGEQVDLLVARAEGLSPIASVPLTFRHALTSPKVAARVTAPDWRVAITGISFQGLAYQGTYTFPIWPLDPNSIAGWSVDRKQLTGYDAPLAINGTADPAGGAVKDAVVLTTDSYVPLLSSAPNASLFLLPQTLGAEAKMVIRYNIYNASSMSPIVGMQSVPIDLSGEVWAAGSRVTFRLSFDPKPAGEVGSEVRFVSSVAQWQDN